uniref:hypothetical protein n=1 Tax=Pseudonocardia nigra TaxID=1921578 RepID=UPI001C5FB639
RAPSRALLDPAAYLDAPKNSRRANEEKINYNNRGLTGPAPSGSYRPRIIEIRENLIARIAEAEREGWLGEVEGLNISLAGATDKLAQIDRRSPGDAINLGMPSAPPPRDAAQHQDH